MAPFQRFALSRFNDIIVVLHHASLVGNLFERGERQLQLIKIPVSYETMKEPAKRPTSGESLAPEISALGKVASANTAVAASKQPTNKSKSLHQNSP